MSDASKRGRDFEMSIARQMRRKGFKAYRDKKSGGGDLYKADIAAPGFNYHIEAKSQEKIKLLEFWRQAVNSCPGYKMPALALDTPEGELMVVRLNDFLDMVKTIADDTTTIKELRNGKR